MYWEPREWKLVTLVNGGNMLYIQTGTLPVFDANGAPLEKRIVYRNGKDGMEGTAVRFVYDPKKGADCPGRQRAEQFLANLVKGLTQAPPPPPEPKPEPKPAPEKKSPGRPKKSDA